MGFNKSTNQQLQPSPNGYKRTAAIFQKFDFLLNKRTAAACWHAQRKGFEKAGVFSALSSNQTNLGQFQKTLSCAFIFLALN